MKKSTMVVLALVVVVAVIAGATYFLMSPASGSGTLFVGITDGPVGNVSHIYLAISSITLQGTGNASTTYKVNSTAFDMLSLINVTKMLGSQTVPVGNYTMIRFTVISAVATIAGSNRTLTVPSGEVKVPLNFQVSSGKTTTVVLDVTADMTSISASGNLRPVVTVKSIQGPS
jgi:hypothetical protein